MKRKIIFVTAIMMTFASCCKEICTNRNSYQTADGHVAELRHGVYFRINGQKVVKYRFQDSETWHGCEGFRLQGDTILFESDNIKSKFYHAEN